MVFVPNFLKPILAAFLGGFCGTVINNYSYEKDYAVLISLSVKSFVWKSIKRIEVKLNQCRHVQNLVC